MNQGIWVLNKVDIDNKHIKSQGNGIWTGQCKVFGTNMSNGKHRETTNQVKFTYTNGKVIIDKVHRDTLSDYEKEWVGEMIIEQIKLHD